MTESRDHPLPRNPIVHYPMTWASGGLLVFAILIDSVLAHSEQLGLGQLAEHVDIVLVGLMLCGTATLLGLWYRLRPAWRAIVARKPDWGLIVTLAAVLAAGLHRWFIAAIIAFASSLWLSLRRSTSGSLERRRDVAPAESSDERAR